MTSSTPPPGIDLAADQGPRVVKSGVVFFILPTIFVFLRFVSRVSVRAGFWVSHGHPLLSGSYWLIW